jgi:hypothetical protein
MLKSLDLASTIPIHHDDPANVDDADKAPGHTASRPPALARGSHPAIGLDERDRVDERGHVDERDRIDDRHRVQARDRIGNRDRDDRDRVSGIAKPKGKSRGESVARFLYFLSGALIAAAVALFGGRLWREARHLPTPATTATPTAAFAVIAANGRVELATDRHRVARIERGGPRWTASQPTALDALEITGPVVLGHTTGAIVALDLESGRTRFTWALPGDERWGAPRPVALGACLVTITTRNRKTVVRCLDLAAGAVRWTAALSGAHDCTQPPTAVPGAYLVQCPGWTAVLDERNGAISVEPGSAGLVQDKPPYLLRAGTRLALAPWSPTRRRFTSSGEIAYGAGNAASSSAVLYQGRLVMRAIDSSDELAIITPPGGRPITIAAPVYRLADATPLVRACGGETSPRFQLLELAPRIGASFDPAAVQDRALALLDVETATLAWTSRKLAGLHHAHAAQPPICLGGHYFLPLEVPDRAGTPTSVLWAIDAQTGKTAAAVAFDADMEASFAELTADQIDGERVVGVGHKGAFELAWRSPGHGLHDARRELETALGPLP